MNINCDLFLENLDNITDGCIGYLQKIIIPQVIQHIYCEMLIGGRKIVNSNVFFQSLISGQMFKIILQSLKGYFTKWCHRNPLLTNRYVTLI